MTFTRGRKLCSQMPCLSQYSQACYRTPLRSIHTSMQELINSKQIILRRLQGLLNQAFLYDQEWAPNIRQMKPPVSGQSSTTPGQFSKIGTTTSGLLGCLNAINVSVVWQLQFLKGKVDKKTSCESFVIIWLLGFFFF